MTVTQPASLIGTVRKVHWYYDGQLIPQSSGLYLTLNCKREVWFKYYESAQGLWYASCAELKTNEPHWSAVIGTSEASSQVTAWASV